MFVFEYNNWIPPRPEPQRPEQVNDESVPVSWALIGFGIAVAPVGVAFWGSILWLILG